MNPVFRHALAIAAVLASTSALAQPKPALVQDRDEPGRNAYQETVLQAPDDAHCFSPGTPRTNCWAIFTTVPAGKRLVVTYAAAWVYFQDAGSPPVAYVTAGTFIGLLPPMTKVRNDFFQLGTPVTLYVEAGQSPHFNVEANNLAPTSSMYLMLSGYYVNLP